MTLIQDHISKFKVVVHMKPKYLHSIRWIWMIINTIIVHDPKVYHNFVPRSDIQGQGHSAQVAKIHVGVLSF